MYELESKKYYDSKMRKAQNKHNTKNVHKTNLQASRVLLGCQLVSSKQTKLGNNKMKLRNLKFELKILCE